MNAISITGVIVKKWRYGPDRFVRLAVPRSPALPAKMEDEDRDGKLIRRNNDYVSVRLPSRLFGGLPVDFEPRQELEVTGYIQSRDYYEDLATFLKRAEGPKLELDAYDPGALAIKRSAVEVVALTVTRIENGRKEVYVVDQESLIDDAPVEPPN